MGRAHAYPRLGVYRALGGRGRPRAVPLYDLRRSSRVAERREVLEFTPFTRNIPADTPLELTLRKGRNSVLVFFDDLAERDAAFLLRLCWQGTDAPPEQRVPVGAANPTLLEQGEQAMRSLCFSRNHYAAGVKILSPSRRCM